MPEKKMTEFEGSQVVNFLHSDNNTSIPNESNSNLIDKLQGDIAYFKKQIEYAKTSEKRNIEQLATAKANLPPGVFANYITKAQNQDIYKARTRITDWSLKLKNANKQLADALKMTKTIPPSTTDPLGNSTITSATNDLYKPLLLIGALVVAIIILK